MGHWRGLGCGWAAAALPHWGVRNWLQQPLGTLCALYTIKKERRGKGGEKKNCLILFSDHNKTCTKTGQDILVRIRHYCSSFTRVHRCRANSLPRVTKRWKDDLVYISRSNQHMRTRRKEIQVHECKLQAVKPKRPCQQKKGEHWAKLQNACTKCTYRNILKLGVPVRVSDEVKKDG